LSDPNENLFLRIRPVEDIASAWTGGTARLALWPAASGLAAPGLTALWWLTTLWLATLGLAALRLSALSALLLTVTGI